MAHFLRGKQSGVQRDFSAGLDSQLFAIDQVWRALSVSLGQAKQDLLGDSVWHQFASQRVRVRPHTVSLGSWHQRHEVWHWADIRLWTEARHGHSEADEESIRQDPTILFGQIDLRR